MYSLNLNMERKRKIARLVKATILDELKTKEYCEFDILYHPVHRLYEVQSDTNKTEKYISEGWIFLKHIEYYANQDKPLIKDLVHEL